MSEANSHVCYADRAWHGAATVVENFRVARDTYRVRLACPEIANRVLPGQFVMLRLNAGNDPLLGRPLAVYDVLPGPDGRPGELAIVYIAVGRMTRRLAAVAPGASMEIWGPLGNGFPVEPVEHLVMVAGGIGQTPFLMLGREYLGRQRYGDPPRDVAAARRVSLCYGARSAEYLAGVDDFRAAGVDVQLATDDGSAGHRGLVTDLIAPAVRGSNMACRIVCCGPEPMLKAAARVAEHLDVACQVSLETPMACGIGICFSCVAKIRYGDGSWDYRRTCVEGPVFDAQRVEFD